MEITLLLILALVQNVKEGMNFIAMKKIVELWPTWLQKDSKKMQSPCLKAIFGHSEPLYMKYYQGKCHLVRKVENLKSIIPVLFCPFPIFLQTYNI